jgi:Aspartyl protease
LVEGRPGLFQASRSRTYEFSIYASPVLEEGRALTREAIGEPHAVAALRSAECVDANSEAQRRLTDMTMLLQKLRLKNSCESVSCIQQRLVCRSLTLSATIFAVGILYGITGDVRAASSEQALLRKNEVPVFANADEYSHVIESVSDGASLSPIAEMTGAGGLKWFMVKTRNGNVGWIKAGDTIVGTKIDDHFRSLPKDAASVGPASSAPVVASTARSAAAITIPVRIERAKVFVPVTLASGPGSATGLLVVDTGAGRTMISKRLARELRLFSADTQTSTGIGVAFVADVGQVESVKVGGAEVRNMRVDIHDGSYGFGAEGLLGFDFLGRFRMVVDADKKVMVLTPRN